MAIGSSPPPTGRRAHRRHLSGKAALELAVEVGDRAAGDSFFDHQEAKTSSNAAPQGLAS